jgi:hypothetical protein
MEAEFHGDPVRPQAGSLVYRIPAWDVPEQLEAAGFSDTRLHHVASWKHGVLGSDLPGVLVIEAQRCAVIAMPQSRKQASRKPGLPVNRFT